MAENETRTENQSSNAAGVVFYGPHPCERCGRTIAKAAREQGGEEFDYPDGPIYPNTRWALHVCAPAVEGA